jgi:hypothetical protein
MALRSVFAAFLLFAASAVPASAAPGVSVKDPGGGERWTATESAGPGGRTCVALRRGDRSRGRTCARLAGPVSYSYVVRTEGARDPRAVRTVLVVALAPDVVRARLSTPDGVRAYRRRTGRARILLVVLAGRVERPPLTVEVRRDGRTTVAREGGEPAAQVADPVGGPAWRSRTAAASGAGVCAAWERVPPRYARPPSPLRGTPRCGDGRGDLPVAAVQRVAGRVVVFGVAGADVRDVVLRGAPGGERPVAMERSTRALLAVLPGGADPSALRLVARLGDGREVERAPAVVR